MTMLLVVFVAGAAGATCRYLLDGVVQGRWNGPFPMGTFSVNVTGSLLLGTLTGFVAAHASVPTAVKTGLGTGFIGAFTTFSTLSYESLRLLREGAPRYALANLFGSVAAGMAAAAIGLAIGWAI